MIIDSFANESKFGTITNDLDERYDTDYHLDATEFLKLLPPQSADMVLYDPPYSPRQVSECYKAMHRSVNMQTTQAASYFANKAKYISTEKRWEIFLNRLDGKELIVVPPDIFLEGRRRLTADDVSLDEEIMQDDNALEFYLKTAFDPVEVFGNAVSIAGTDGYVNIYARYDMKTGSVMDMLDVYLMGGDGHELAFKYKLSPEEQEILLPAMESYCIQRMGMGLDACCRQYLDEDGEQALQDGQTSFQTDQTM